MFALVDCRLVLMERFKLVAQWQHITSGPARCFPAVEIDPLCTSVHHEVDGRPSAENTSRWYNSFTPIEVIRGFGLVKLHTLIISDANVFK